MFLPNMPPRFNRGGMFHYICAKKNGNGIQFPGISYAVCSDRCCKVAVRKFFGVILLAVVEIVKVED